MWPSALGPKILSALYMFHSLRPFVLFLVFNTSQGNKKVKIDYNSLMHNWRAAGRSTGGAVRAMGWVIWGSNSGRGKNICLFCKSSKPVVGSSKPPANLYWGSFRGVKRPPIRTGVLLGGKAYTNLYRVSFRG